MNDMANHNKVSPKLERISPQPTETVCNMLFWSPKIGLTSIKSNATKHPVSATASLLETSQEICELGADVVKRKTGHLFLTKYSVLHGM